MCYHFVLHRLRAPDDEHLALDKSFPNNTPSPDLVSRRRILTEGLLLCVIKSL